MKSDSLDIYCVPLAKPEPRGLERFYGCIITPALLFEIERECRLLLDMIEREGRLRFPQAEGIMLLAASEWTRGQVNVATIYHPEVPDGQIWLVRPIGDLVKCPANYASHALGIVDVDMPMEVLERYEAEQFRRKDENCGNHKRGLLGEGGP
jgi:hypothetical protein